MNKIISIIVVLVLIVGGVFLYRHRSSNMDMSDAPSSETTSTTDNTSSDQTAGTSTIQGSITVTAPNVKSFTVTGSSFAFAPNTLTVNKGDTVKIHFVNSGGMHDFVIDEFNARTSRIQGGQSEDITFVADKAGTFEYYCSVGTHRQMGMRGTLTVK